MMEIATNIGAAAAYAAVVLAFMLVARIVNRILFRPGPQGPQGAGDGTNVALALRHAGLYLAIAIAMTAVSRDAQRSFLPELLLYLRDGAFVLAALIAAQKINDWCIVPGLNNDRAVAAGNTAVGLTEFGSSIATGLIASVSFSDGEATWMIVLVFFALGQLALLLVFWVQELLLQGSFIEEVKHGSTGAGVTVAGVLIAFGIILRASIAGPFLGWQASLTGFAIFAAVGIVLLTIFQEVFNSVLVKRLPIEERYHNVATSTIVACGQIGLAIVISTLM